MTMPGAAEHRGCDRSAPAVLAKVLGEAIAAIEKADIPYLLVGGLASAALGRPRWSAAVDILVKPLDAGAVLAALSDVLGRMVRVAPAEDLIVMKAVIHREETPRHWHDALGLIAAGDIDWDYLTQRARKGNRRVLSLLLYALSEDLIVPMGPLDALYERIFSGDQPDVD